MATLTDSRGRDRGVRRSPTGPELVQVPPYDFLVVDGVGDPESSPDYHDTVTALEVVSAEVVDGLRDRDGPGGVGPVEVLRWSEGPRRTAAGRGDPRDRRWSLMVRQPDAVPDDVLAEALARASKELGSVVVDRVQSRHLEEGPCVQMVHVGPFASQGPTLTRLHVFVADSGLRLRGRHHEVYLADPLHCPPERLRTLLRHPVC